MLVIGDLDGGDLTEAPLSSNVEFSAPDIRWGPNPSKLLATGRTGKTEGVNDIFTIDITSGETERIVSAGPQCIAVHPQWSPDGQSVYFVRRCADGGSRIVAYDRHSGQETVLHEGRVNNMEVSPDGLWIAYTGADEEPRLRIIPTRGGESRVLFRSSETQPFNGRSPIAWSPDSSHLCFCILAASATPRSEDRVELCSIARTGGEPTPMGLSMSNLSRVSVDPDGRHLAFGTMEYHMTIWSVENLLQALDGTTED